MNVTNDNDHRVEFNKPTDKVKNLVMAYKLNDSNNYECDHNLKIDHMIVDTYLNTNDLTNQFSDIHLK